MFALSQRSQKHLQGVDERLIKVVETALTLTNVDFGVPNTGGVRTAEQQLALYNAGKSTLDGYGKRSNHQDGVAVDVFAYVDGEASWDKGDLAEVATAMFAAAQVQGIKIKWGGHWKSFKDYPHFELA